MSRFRGVTTAITLPALGLSVLIGVSFSATAKDSPADACIEAARLSEQGDLEGALEEARWCVNGLEQLQRQQTLSAFPDVVDGFAGGELQDQTVLGMTTMERRYERGEHTVSVMLSTGGAGVGLAALAQIGMQLGAVVGEKMRVQQRTVVDMSGDKQAGKAAKFMVQLRSGGTLLIGSDTLPRAQLLEFVETFPIRELDESLER